MIATPGGAEIVDEYNQGPPLIVESWYSFNDDMSSDFAARWQEKQGRHVQRCASEVWVFTARAVKVPKHKMPRVAPLALAHYTRPTDTVHVHVGARIISLHLIVTL